MQSVIDSHILNDFFANRPTESITDEDLEKLVEWKQFREFIKAESDLVIADYNALNPEIFKLLTDGRGETKKPRAEKKINTHGGIISGDYSPSTFFCLVEPLVKNREKIKTNNGYLVGFEDDYISKWTELSFRCRSTLIPIDKNNPDSLKSWDDFGLFLLPFTDVIICDAFILSDVSLIKSNLLELWKRLDSFNPVKYNLLIVTNEGNPKMDIKKEFDKLNEYRIDNNLKANLSLVFSSYIDKEHDRNIFMNYIRVKSGDSFNYFNSALKIITKGTEIDIYPCSDPQKEKATLSILKRVTNMIKNSSEEKSLSSYEGKIFNRLLID